MSQSKTKQEHLITPVGFVLLVFFVITLMVILYPSGETLFSDDTSSGELKTLFKNPDKLRYEQTLHQQSLSPSEILDTVEYLSERGLWKESRHLLTNKLPDQLNGEDRREAALWMLQSYLDEYYISQSKGEKIERPLGSARAQLQRFEQLEQLSIDELRLLAKSSLEFGLIPQAIQTYFRLAKLDHKHRLDWLDQAGSKAMQIQYYSDAVKAYKWASEISKQTAAQQTYRYAWLNAANKAGHNDDVQQLIANIEDNLPNDSMELQKLATISLEIGRPSIAHRIYAQLATVDHQRAKHWYEKAGVWALSNQEYLPAADYFLQAEQLSRKPAEIERLQYKQYEVFTAAEMPQKALQKVQTILENHSDDNHLLQKGINTALAAKETQLARKWNTAYLQKHPNNFTALQLQADIEIRDKQYVPAIEYLHKLLVINPKHLDSHKKLAFLLEVQGKDVQALQAWQTIHQLAPKAEYQKNILRLAQATLKQGTGLAILLQFSQKNALPEQAVQDIVSYYTEQNPSKAEPFLSRYLTQHQSSLAVWKRLVSLQNQHPARALATWKQIEQRFGSNNTTLLARIEILWAMQNSDAVLAIYDAHPQLPIKSRYHHQIVAELMWKVERFQPALQHYHSLLKEAKPEDKVAYYQRIIAIHLKRKDTKQALASLHQAWQATQNSDILLQALQVAFTQNIASELQAFQKIAKQNEALFTRNINYWQLQAQIAAQALQYKQAQAHYQKVLSLQPNSIVARQGVLWVLMQTKQKQALRDTLLKWQKLATKQEKLWASYALAYQTLGDTKRSLPWYQHYINKHRKDFSMLLGYADQLDKLRRYDSAYRVRQVAVAQLQRFTKKNKINKAQRKEALFQYLSMVQRYGSEKEFTTLQKQLQNQYNSTTDKTRLNEVAIAWLLSKKYDEKLRYQLTKAHQQRLKTPFWQLLAIAIKKKDKPAIDKLLANAKSIRLEEKVLALIASHKTGRAYRLALQGIDAKRSSKEREDARSLALSVAKDHASSVTSQLTQKEIGELTMQSVGMVYHQGMRADLPVGYDLSVTKNRLHYGDLSANETDVSASAEWKQGKHRVSATLGVNQRKDDNLYYANARYQHQFSEDLNVAIELGKNEISNEGSLLRMVAKRDRIKADVNAHLGKQNYLSASAWQQKFATRKGEKLAAGQGVSGSLIHKEKMGSSQWHMGVQAQIENNKTEKNLPKNVRDISQQQSIVIDNPKSLGLIAGINHGDPAKGISGISSPRYSANAWVGKSWPTGKVGANVEASIGSKILGSDELSVTAYANGVAGSNGQQDQGIRMQYQKWFDIDADNQRYRIEQ